MDDAIEPVELRAGDLLLRPFRPDDADAVFDACQDPEIQRWTTVPSPYGRSDAEWFVAACADRWAAGNPTFAVVDPGSERLMAAVDLQEVHAEQGPCVGFWVSAAARHRGVATASVRRLAQWAFEDLRLPRIRWTGYLGNVGSRRVAEAVGFANGRLIATSPGATRHPSRRLAWLAPSLRPRPHGSGQIGSRSADRGVAIRTGRAAQ